MNIHKKQNHLYDKNEQKVKLSQNSNLPSNISAPVTEVCKCDLRHLTQTLEDLRPVSMFGLVT